MNLIQVVALLAHVAIPYVAIVYVEVIIAVHVVVAHSMLIVDHNMLIVVHHVLIADPFVDVRVDFRVDVRVDARVVIHNASNILVHVGVLIPVPIAVHVDAYFAIEVLIPNFGDDLKDNVVIHLSFQSSIVNLPSVLVSSVVRLPVFEYKLALLQRSNVAIDNLLSLFTVSFVAALGYTCIDLMLYI